MGERRREGRKQLYSLFWNKRIKAALFMLLPVLHLLLPIKYQVFAEEKGAREDGREQVLIVCYESTDAAFLSNMAKAFGKDTVVIMEEAYEPDMADSFSYVITTSSVCMKDVEERGIFTLCLREACSKKDISTVASGKSSIAFQSESWSEAAVIEENVRYLTRSGDEQMGTVSMSGVKTVPFLTQQGRILYVPFYREEGLGAVMIGNAMARLFQEEEKGRLYLAIDEVYPFSDLNLLCRMADLLYKNGIPFSVRVMPVYDNLGYPAFQRYAQVLRYVQAKNGTVLIHPALVREEEAENEPLEVRMERFESALEEENIFYVGYEYAPFLLSWEELKNIKAETKNFGTFKFPAMFTVPSDTEWEEFESFVDQVNAKWLTLNDLKAEFIQEKFLYLEKPVEAAFEEGEEQKAGFQNFFDQGDRILLVVVGIGLTVFMILIAIGAKWYRKKFMERQDEKEESG